MHEYFVPFVGETTGRLSKSSLDFLKDICNTKNIESSMAQDIKWAKKRFQEQVSIVIARANASALSTGRRDGHAHQVY